MYKTRLASEENIPIDTVVFTESTYLVGHGTCLPHTLFYTEVFDEEVSSHRI